MTNINEITADSPEPVEADYPGDWNAWAVAKARWSQLQREREQFAAGEAKVAAAIGETPAPPAPPVAPLKIKISKEQIDEAAESFVKSNSIPEVEIPYDDEPSEADEAAINAIFSQNPGVTDEEAGVAVNEVLDSELREAVEEPPAPKKRAPRQPKAAPATDEVEDLLAFFGETVEQKTAVELWRDEQKEQIRGSAGISARMLANLPGDIAPALKTLKRFVEQAEKVIDLVPAEHIELILNLPAE